MIKSRIAILGSTSHIAKGLINNFLNSGEFSLHLYTRSPDKLCIFLDTIGKFTGKSCIIHEGYIDFMESSCDVIINCVGVGTLNQLRGDYTKYFTVTEEYDNLVIEYLKKNPDSVYISFSSGAVYGREHSAPVEENTVNSIRVNHIVKEDYYAIARLNAEAKHRSFTSLNIVDLRLFSYFSRFIDLTDGYFITDVISCVLNKKVLKTNNVNIVRDYVHPDELFLMVRKCINLDKINQIFDVISSNPVNKREILDYYSLEYGLKYKIIESLSHQSATGTKNVYYSINNNATYLSHSPKFSSMDTIKHESKLIMGQD
tara:strand:+ start:2803 stop:3747 length:945 start_codon:yes stop_codon:yes gene_type:complete